MTKFEHMAWYNLVIGNIYAVNGNGIGFAAFVTVAVLCFIVGYFENGRGFRGSRDL